MKFHQVGRNEYIIATSQEQQELDPKGVYQLLYEDSKRWWKLIQLSNYILPSKMYNLGLYRDITERLAYSYAEEGKSGLLMVGPKGNGKSLLAKYITTQINLPTIIIGSNTDTSVIDELGKYKNCIILLDEFDKTFNQLNNQQKFLSLLDGSITNRNIYILSANRRLADGFENRPGRLKYSLNLQLTDDLFNEILDDLLIDKSYIHNFRHLNSMVRLNVNSLIATIKEVNIYGNFENSVNLLNIAQSFQQLKLQTEIEGKVYIGTTSADLANMDFAGDTLMWSMEGNSYRLKAFEVDKKSLSSDEMSFLDIKQNKYFITITDKKPLY